jgi:hypothetical protein
VSLDSIKTHAKIESSTSENKRGLDDAYVRSEAIFCEKELEFLSMREGHE